MTAVVIFLEMVTEIGGNWNVYQFLFTFPPLPPPG